MTPILTDAGKNLLLRALTGETITFTKIQLGNGPAREAGTAAGLVNPLLTVELSKIEVGEGYAALTAAFTNGTVTSGFHITEAGFYAKDPDDGSKELLYAVGNEDESTADYVPDNTNRILEMEFSALLFIGEAENAAAAINGSLVYASAADLDAHIGNKDNPHGVTKEQVGLGNVPNVSTNDQTPTYAAAAVLATLSPGEKMSAAFGKIKLAITALINHIGDKRNPHGVTAAQVNAAPISHIHNASDINDGVLSVARGGTGVATLDALLTLVGSNLFVVGHYIGDGTQGREIDLGFHPRAVLLFSAFGNTNNALDDNCGGLALRNYNCIRRGASNAYVTTWSSDQCVLGVTSSGFKVNYSDSCIRSNESGVHFYYIAFR